MQTGLAPLSLLVPTFHLSPLVPHKHGLSLGTSKLTVNAGVPSPPVLKTSRVMLARFTCWTLSGSWTHLDRTLPCSTFGLATLWANIYPLAMLSHVLTTYWRRSPTLLVLLGLKATYGFLMKILKLTVCWCLLDLSIVQRYC